MRELLTRFSLDAIKFNGQVLACLLIIWAVVLACSISSILGQNFDRRRRLFWIVFVIAVPVAGLLAYLPFSFKREELPYLLQNRSSKGKRQQGRKTN